MSNNERDNAVGRIQPHRHRRNLRPLRRLADRRGLLPGGDLRLGARLLRPKRLSRRTASPARLAGLADLVGHDLLLSVRRGAGRLCQRGDAGVRPAQLPARRHRGDGRRRGHDRPGHRALAALSCRRAAGVRLGRHQPRRHHQHARPLVRQQARHGDQPRAERREFWRHRRRAAAGRGDRAFRVFRRHDRGGGRDAGADDPGHPDLCRAAARACDAATRIGGRGGAVRRADPRAGVARRRIPDGVDRVRAGAVRAGRLHRPSDFVPRSGDRPQQRGDRGRAADGDGGGRARAVLDRDRPAQPAAGFGDLVRKPGRWRSRSSSIRATKWC